METDLAYPFTADHDLSTTELATMLGGKGAGLAAMTAAGLPVPPGFTIPTAACRSFLANGWSAELEQAIEAGIDELERQSGKSLGSLHAPLLVSVRSGAEVSMPGMMDTVLNVGMTAELEGALATLSGSAEFAADTHRRALVGFAEIVLGADRPTLDAVRPMTDPAEIISALAAAGLAVPADPREQIKRAVRVVFESWGSPRAVRYREIEGIDGSLGTAATVQSMVFGNMGQQSGTGVAFTRNPTTGEPGLMGDFLTNAQGEDVVAGSRVTSPLTAMRETWPALYTELERIADLLEQRYQDMVDIEFTVEAGALWMLQSRRGKRSPLAAFRVAIDMAEDPTFAVDRAEAVNRCLRYFAAPPTIVDPLVETDCPVIARGLGASPGTASGVLCLDPDQAVQLQDQGIDLILARRETSPADVHGMAASKGLFTTLGGQVSHAALVSREWGIPAVVGASEAEILDGALVGPGGRVEEGELVTVDGTGGRLLLGRWSVDGEVAPEVLVVEQWAAELEGDVAPLAETSVEADTSAVPAAAGIAATGSVDLSFHVFHALRIKGMVTAPAITAICGSDEASVAQILDRLVGDGQATYMEPRQMWVITADGRSAHQPVLADVVSDLDLAQVPYQPFLQLNDDFKQLCTDWQVKDGEPNDHGDEGYDRTIFERLEQLDDVAQPIIAEIAQTVPWTVGYGPRLSAARARLFEGDTKALTGVMCDSYHDIWMELHEDLILTQGIDRAAEGST